ncbi:MAG: aldo/keto reductase [Lachnospiraceae bacterium]|nr:aldo/keto reductase [Lachnospiraceae bacterium]
MHYRELGKTGLLVSEIGLGAEWLERHDYDECKAIIDRAQELGINILDCWMSEPAVRTKIGKAIAGHREKWYIQGHIGSTWQGGQYVRTRDVEKCKEAFEDLLSRLQTDYIDLGMIHFVDQEEDFVAVMEGAYMEYVKDLKKSGKIRHIGMSTHNPDMAVKAVESGIVEMLLFSINPAFDMLPPTDNIDHYFADHYEEGLGGIDPARKRLYRLCEQHGVGLTVMKPYAGGRLFDEKRSPFGVALTPIQCIHYCLTRPAVSSVLAGYDTLEHVDAAVAYENATEDEKDYATTLSLAPYHTFGQGECTYCGHCKPCPVNIDIALVNKYYDLASMQDETPSSIKSHYFDLAHHADECIGCHACETRCPFGVKIADRMEQTAAYFGHSSKTPLIYTDDH